MITIEEISKINEAAVKEFKTKPAEYSVVYWKDNNVSVERCLHNIHDCHTFLKNEFSKDSVNFAIIIPTYNPCNGTHVYFYGVATISQNASLNNNNTFFVSAPFSLYFDSSTIARFGKNELDFEWFYNTFLSELTVLETLLGVVYMSPLASTYENVNEDFMYLKNYLKNALNNIRLIKQPSISLLEEALLKLKKTIKNASLQITCEIKLS